MEAKKGGIAKQIKGRSSKFLRVKFPNLEEWFPRHLRASSCSMVRWNTNRGWWRKYGNKNLACFVNRNCFG